MAGNVIASVLQIGDSGTATQNFVLKVPAAPDGTLLLQRGNYGAESATIATVSAAGAMAIHGTATNDSAAAGYVGEYKESIFASTNMLVTTTNLTSISLTAGDWDVSAVFSSGSVSTQKAALIGVSTAGTEDNGASAWFASDTTDGLVGGSIPCVRISVATTTTVYCVGRTITATLSVGGRLSARRVR